MAKKIYDQLYYIAAAITAFAFMTYMNMNQVFANFGKMPSPNSSSGGSALDSVMTIMYNFGTGLAVLVFGVSVIVIVWAGFKYATSEGELGVVEKAKKQIIYAGIGIGIAIFAFIIVEVFAEVYGIKDITTSKIK